MPTSWDARLLARAAVAAALALLITWLVTAATDEGGISWVERAGRTLPLAPACAAVGAWVALAPLRSRGEARALEALGQSPFRVAAGAVAGSGAVALTAAVVLGVSRRADLAGFFPTATRGSTWVWLRGEFVDAVRGLRVGADGAPALFPRVSAVTFGGIPSLGRLAAVVSTAAAGIALPLLVAEASLAPSGDPRQSVTDRRHRQRMLVVLGVVAGGALTATVFLFQAAAARLVHPAWSVLPPLALLLFAFHRHRK